MIQYQTQINHLSCERNFTEINYTVTDQIIISLNGMSHIHEENYEKNSGIRVKY